MSYLSRIIWILPALRAASIFVGFSGPCTYVLFYPSSSSYCYFAEFYNPQMFLFASTFHSTRELSVWMSVLDADARNQQIARGCMSRLFIPSDLPSASISRGFVSLRVTLDRVPVASHLVRFISCFLRRRTVYIHSDRVRGYTGASSSSQIFPRTRFRRATKSQSRIWSRLKNNVRSAELNHKGLNVGEC
jgi:hypothetical protein